MTPPKFKIYMPVLLIMVGLSIPLLAVTDGFQCPVGDPVSADLGDGVTMRTCLLKQEPDISVRTGPLELTRNGIVILKLQTNVNGKLHGRFTSWNDDGKLTNDGMYVEGLKQGSWLETDNIGNSATRYYLKGNLVNP